MNQPAAPHETLAIDGGKPLRTHPFAPWPVFAEDERKAVEAVLASGKVNYWTGEECKAFEREFAVYVGGAHAISLANGTLALELALRALGVGAGDEVIVPAKTFVATASCAVAVGATPVVCDVDPDSQLMTADTVRALIGPRTRALIPVHLGGWPCEMGPLADLARERGVAIVEDCAQAPGAKWRGKQVGTFGEVAIFSFCQDKIITTGGEGGMLLTSDRELWARAWAYKDHGKSWEAVHERNHPPGFRWQHESFGSNFRMTEMQAAIGRVQLRKMDAWIETRRRNAAALIAGLSAVPAVRVPMPSADCFNSHYRVYAQIDLARLRSGWDGPRIADAVAAEGVFCQQGGCSEIYRERAFTDAGLAPAKRWPVAARLSDASLMFLVHPTLTEADMRDAARAVAKVMKEAVSA
jgi:dTDP-4-amino-4,6-dideoxygalactose transaminase